MKITLESPSRMVLKDYNVSGFLFGILLFFIGAGVGFFFSKQGILVIAIGAILSLVGLYILATTKVVTVILDKESGKCRFSLQGLIKREGKEIGFGDVKELVLQKTLTTSSSGREGGSTDYQYALIFVLKDGGEIPLEFGKISAGIMDVLSSPHEKKRKEAQQVADFLGVSLKLIGPPSTTEVLSTLKEGIAEGIERYSKRKEQS